MPAPGGTLLRRLLAIDSPSGFTHGVLEEAEGQIARILSANNRPGKTGNVRSALERARKAAGQQTKEDGT